MRSAAVSLDQWREPSHADFAFCLLILWSSQLTSTSQDGDRSGAPTRQFLRSKSPRVSETSQSRSPVPLL